LTVRLNDSQDVRRFVKRHFGAVIRVVTLAFVAACSSISTDTGSTEVPIPRSSWLAQGLPVHTRLSATKDSIVYGGVGQTGFYVVALDPTTGKERWREASDMSGRSNWKEPSILTDGDTAYFLAGRHSGIALVAVATETGKERWRTGLVGESAEPAISCGNAICVVVSRCACERGWSLPRKEMWRFSKADGTLLSQHLLAADVGNQEVVLSVDSSNDADTTVLLASFGQAVYITRFDHFGEKMAWAKPVPDLFGPTPVDPKSGWDSQRVAGGWVVSLARKDRTVGEITPGEVLQSGAVTRIDDDGKVGWVAADRDMCGMIFDSTTDKPLCDGDIRILSAEEYERRPNVVEGRDTTTGGVKWRLDLQGEIDEAKPGEKIVRIDENRYLVGLTRGRVMIDLRHGLESTPNEEPTGWCTPDRKLDKIGFGVARSYPRASNPFPCRLGGNHLEPSLPIPKFAGVTVAGWGAWVEDGQVHAKRQ
jgi:hypothetical protein